jgi:hypothetical protein
MDAEGETLRLADAGETLRLQYHRGMHLWRAPVRETGHRRGKPLDRQESNLSGIRDRAKAVWLALSFYFYR